MSYTGEVAPGGPADVRDLSLLTVTKIAVDPKTANNAYVLQCRQTGKQLLIDAAAEPETLKRHLDPEALKVIVTTHRHGDHHRALAELVEWSGATTIAGDPDFLEINKATGVLIERVAYLGDTVTIGNARLEVIPLRGHTEGSIALLYSDPGGDLHLFTGDSLFPGGVGNTFGDKAAFESLMHDVEERIFFRLPDSTWFYPGHGNDSTLGAERPHLGEWRERGW